MKNKFILLFVMFLVSLSVFSQEKQNTNFHQKQAFYLYANPLQHLSFMNKDVICDCGYKLINNFEIGAFYQLQTSSKFSYEIGIEYNHSKVKSYWYPEGVRHSAKIDIDILSFPVRTNYYFAKSIYLQTGLLFDYQLTDSFRDQTGLGLSVGIGSKFDFNKWTFFLKPNYKRHAIITLKDHGYHRIAEIGIQFGIGYTW